MLIAGITVLLLGGTAAYLSSFTRQEALVLALPMAGDQPSAWSRRVARLLVKSWRSCPPLQAGPESAIGFVVNALTADAAQGAAEEVRSVIVDLLAAGCDINEYSSFGRTPLMNAVLYADPKAVQMLLALGADPQLRLRPGSARSTSPPAFEKSVEGLNCAEFAERLITRLTERNLPTDNARAVLRLLQASGRPAA